MSFAKILGTLVGLELGIPTATWIVRNEEPPLTYTYRLQHRGHLYKCRVGYSHNGLQAITAVYDGETSDPGKSRFIRSIGDLPEYLDSVCPFPVELPATHIYTKHLLERDYQRRRWIRVYQECSPVGSKIYNYLFTDQKAKE